MRSTITAICTAAAFVLGSSVVFAQGAPGPGQEHANVHRMRHQHHHYAKHPHHGRGHVHKRPGQEKGEMHNPQ
jgi:hypothetical protein